jgi:hypothetical protein
MSIVVQDAMGSGNKKPIHRSCCCPLSLTKQRNKETNKNGIKISNKAKEKLQL